MVGVAFFKKRVYDRAYTSELITSLSTTHMIRARWKSHSQQECLTSDMLLGGGARAPLHWSCTSRAVAREQDKNSKIRARLDLRLDESYTMHASDTRGSRRCEQEVSGQKVGHRTRPGPVLWFEPLDAYSTPTRAYSALARQVIAIPLSTSGA